MHRFSWKNASHRGLAAGDALHAQIEVFEIDKLVAVSEVDRSFGGGHLGDFIVGEEFQEPIAGNILASIVIFHGRIFVYFNLLLRKGVGRHWCKRTDQNVAVD